MPPNFCTSSVLFCDDGVDDVVDRDDAETWPASSTTGTASRSYCEISRATSSRSVSGETVIGLRSGAPISDVVARARRRSAGAATPPAASAVVADRARRWHRPSRACARPGGCGRSVCADRPGRGHADELGGHDGCRRVSSGIGEQPLQRALRVRDRAGQQVRAGRLVKMRGRRRRRGRPTCRRESRRPESRRQAPRRCSAAQSSPGWSRTSTARSCGRLRRMAAATSGGSAFSASTISGARSSARRAASAAGRRAASSEGARALLSMAHLWA